MKKYLFEYKEVIIFYLTIILSFILNPVSKIISYFLDILINIINDSGDNKILVFSQFTKVLEVIKERLS